ncbi:MAG: response regulator, partial [Verrucomicrobiaceae bacterium]
MYRSLNLNEDLALKQVVTDRFSLTDRGFAWRDVIPTDKRQPLTDIIVTRGNTESHFSLEDVADAKVVASSGTENEAVAWLKGNPDLWDLALVDLFLEQGNGLAVVKACRQRRQAQKVVVLSNYATAEMRGRAAQLGADA